MNLIMNSVGLPEFVICILYPSAWPAETYNIGTGVSTEFNEIFKIIKEEMNYDGTPQYIPNPLRSYQGLTQADMNKTKKELKFEPSYYIRRGVRKILEQLR